MDRRQRALAIADGRTLVSSDPTTVAWLTGHAPHDDGAGATVVLDDRGIRLVLSVEETAGFDPGVEAVRFGEDGEAARLVASLVGGRRIVADGPAVSRSRAVKDPDEIEGIRAALVVADAGQAAARAALVAGSTELELWAVVCSAMEAAAATPILIRGDFVTGPRTAGEGGLPSERVVQERDLLLVDLFPRVAGWWSDSCSTVALGEPPSHVREAHAAALEALAAVKRMVRPGVRAAEVDAAARAIVDFPHHTGHGVGRIAHDEPKIVPEAGAVLEAGMVIALEPGTYGEDWGVRVEQVVLVTGEGCEVLSQHDLSLEVSRFGRAGSG